MDNQPSGISFAIVGHLDTWQKIEKLTNVWRQGIPLPIEKVKEIFSFIPPRKILDIEVTSPIAGVLKGAYIETFISPDELNHSHLGKNLQKVKQACRCAASLKANIVSLGGFSSIILEAGREDLSWMNETAFTTGNTLTAAFIADAVEKACDLLGQPLGDCNLLVIGSTGDIGSACVNYFEGATRKLLLAARQPGALKKQVTKLENRNIACSGSTDVNTLLPHADILICAASSLLTNCDLNALPSHAIVCDAGYPKNLQHIPEFNHQRLFSGGMGVALNGFILNPDHRQDLYELPLENIVHGCVLESIVLAMEGNPVPYSYGRGNITKEAMKGILNLATRHSIVTAPFFNESGTWNAELAKNLKLKE
jgi:fatty aldehyde-generating acyl-ACP reductase